MMYFSNVTTQELERYYDWSFQASAADDLALAATGNISHRNLLNKLVKLFEPKEDQDSESEPHHAFSLPAEWFTPEGSSISVSSKDDEALWRQALRTILSTHDPNQHYVKLRPQKDIQAAEFPVSNIFNMNNQNLEGGGIAWSLTNLLALPTFIMQAGLGPKSELEVERLHGTPLSGFFNVPGCETTSNVKLSFRDELLCFGSHPKPDYMARIRRGTIPVKRLNYDLYPVTALGETKKRVSRGSKKITHEEQDSARLQVPSEASMGLRIPVIDGNNSRAAKLPMAAQLAFSAHSSLVMIIASLITEWQDKPPARKGRTPQPEDYKIPEYAIIYGIGYASNGLLIYAFFPYIKSWDKNNFPSKWGFMSVLACRDFSDVFEEHNIQIRFKLAKVLLMIQQHAKKLTEKMKSVKRWPEEFLD